MVKMRVSQGSVSSHLSRKWPMTKPTTMDAGNIRPTEEYSSHLFLPSFTGGAATAYAAGAAPRRRSVVLVLFVIFQVEAVQVLFRLLVAEILLFLVVVGGVEVLLAELVLAGL